jgi:hypothetical protein
MLTVTIGNGISGIKPFTLSLIPDFTGDKITDIGSALASISEVRSASLIPAGFVCVNFSVHTGSLEDVIAELDEQPELRGLIVSSCACHIFGLAFHDALSRDGRLAEIVEDLKVSTEFLR